MTPPINNASGDSRHCVDCRTRAKVVDHGLVLCECGLRTLNCSVCGDPIPKGRLHRGVWSCERTECADRLSWSDLDLADQARRERRLSALEEKRHDRARGERVAAWFEVYGGWVEG